MGALRSVGRSVAMSFSLFSRVPMPQVDWEAGNMRFVMCAFPVVGALEGALLALWAYAASALGLGPLAVAAGLLAIPVLVTGGIHLDGFCDVCDALSSHAEPARKREILKDPRVGAFSVIDVATYLLVSFGVLGELASRSLVDSPDPSVVWSLALVPVVSRCLSGIATIAFPKSPSKGMLAMEGSSDVPARALAILCTLLLASLAGLLAAGPLSGLLMALAALVCLFALMRVALSQFGGMSGDLAGWFLQVAELSMLVCLTIAPGLSALGVVVA